MTSILALVDVLVGLDSRRFDIVYSFFEVPKQIARWLICRQTSNLFAVGVPDEIVVGSESLSAKKITSPTAAHRTEKSAAVCGDAERSTVVGGESQHARYLQQPRYFGVWICLDWQLLPC